MELSYDGCLQAAPLPRDILCLRKPESLWKTHSLQRPKYISKTSGVCTLFLGDALDDLLQHGEQENDIDKPR